MTLPDERTRAVLSAGDFLLDLLDPKKTPRVPLSVRRRASAVLHHFPDSLSFAFGPDQFEWSRRNSESTGVVYIGLGDVVAKMVA